MTLDAPMFNKLDKMTFKYLWDVMSTEWYTNLDMYY